MGSCICSRYPWEYDTRTTDKRDQEGRVLQPLLPSQSRSNARAVGQPGTNESGAAEAETAAFELVLVAKEFHAPKPYGIGFSVEVPLIAALPGASNASVESVFLTFGSTHVAYYKTIHGKKKLFHVRGVVVPKTCPRGGFRLEATIDFADGATLAVTPTIPCPRK